MGKIYPNDKCPCNSGKKYKHCCGNKQSEQKQTESFISGQIDRSDMKLEDFVIKRVGEDAAFLEDALQLIFGPYGYSYCKEHKEELNKEFEKDEFRSFVKRDGMGVYHTAENSDTRKHFMRLRPYGGDIPKAQMDIITLLKYKYICVEGRQVELFHAYLMDNLRRRFDKYCYIPTNVSGEGQKFGSFAHRGYDFALAITLYMELQLGVHVYLNLLHLYKFPKEDVEACRNYFCIDDDIELNTGMIVMLFNYAEIIEDVATRYNAEREVEMYNSAGAYTKEEYPDRKKMIKQEFYKFPLQFDYIRYLRCMVSAICFNRDMMYFQANASFPQCDFIKYMYGLECVTELFEEKIEEREIVPPEVTDVDMLKKFEEADIHLNTEKHIQTRLDIYHTAVFWWMDEFNGVVNHMKPSGFQYKDFAGINEDEYTIKDGLRIINPARKSTSFYRTRKLKMELYNLINGKCFTLRIGDSPGDCDNLHTACKYPILPWISSGKEETVHTRPFDRVARPDEDLYSFDVRKRQDFLTLEYRLTEIPVNCIEEYLNPDVFYNWKQCKELLKETQKQNDELKNVNDKLKRHIKLNEELVRNLSHSSANYLNADKLAKTGIELNQADVGNPGPEKLHLDGLSLILQSEQEMYLSRQLNSLVWRCSADVNSLAQQIRSGLSGDEGVDITAPVEFALKTVIARVLFRENDRRSEFICNKLNKSDEELTLMKSSFMLDILAVTDEPSGNVIEWWQQNVGKFTISKSDAWTKIKIIKDKSFYDLVTEIVTEQILNALSHGDISEGITLELGQAEEFKGRPRWVYISCINQCGNSYTGGRGVGISTLNETMLLLNSDKRGIETCSDENIFESKAWLLGSYLKALKNGEV